MPNKIFYKLSSTQFPINRNKTYDDSNLVDSLIQWEGFLDHPTNIGDNKITLGSGLTDPKWIKLYKEKGNKWSAEDNRAAVAEEVASRRKWAEKNVPNWNKLPFESQQAMLSYKYNYNFTPENSPNMYTALRAFDLPEVARQMDATSDDPKFKKGLQERREREQAWFMEGVKKREKVNSPSFLTNLMDRANHRLEAAQKKAQVISTINDMKDTVKSWPFSKKAEGGSLKSSWDDLSLAEKSKMMKVAIQNGITDLATIRQKYNEFAEGGPEETYNVGYIPEVTIEAERKNNPYIYYDPWSGRYKGIGIGGQRIEYGEGFNPEGSILLPNAQAYENQRLIRAKQDDLNHTNAFANTIRNIALATTVAPMAGPIVEAANAAGMVLHPIVTNPYVQAGIDSYFGAEGITDIKNGETSWTTPIEMLPLVRPLTTATKATITTSKPIIDKSVSFLNSPLTGKWTSFGNRQYRFSPNNLGINGIPVESRPSAKVTDNLLKWMGKQRTYKPEKTALEYLRENRFSEEDERTAKILEQGGVDLSRIGADDIKVIIAKRTSELKKNNPGRFTMVRPSGRANFSLADFVKEEEYPIGEIQLSTIEDGTTFMEDVINYTRNRKLPIHGVQERGLNAAINTSNSIGGTGVITGQRYFSAPKQYHVVQKFKDRKIVGRGGTHENINMIKDDSKPPIYVNSLLDMARAGDKEYRVLENAPVWMLSSPTYHVPTKSTMFDPRNIDVEGIMHINWEDPYIFNYGGTIN